MKYQKQFYSSLGARYYPGKQIQIIKLFRPKYKQACASSQKTGKDYIALSEKGGKSSALKMLRLLNDKGSLTEQEVFHPKIPLKGFIDLVFKGSKGSVLIDFKTGQEKEEHQFQLELYALMWWRMTEEIPAELEVRYFNSRKQFNITESRLNQLETEVKQKIEQIEEDFSTPPALSKTGEHCRFCDVRQFCSSFWTEQPTLPKTKFKTKDQKEWVDLEFTVESDETLYGFSAKLSDGEELQVVYEIEVGQFLGPFEKQEKIRVLGGILIEKGNALELVKSSEVFHC